MHKNDFFNLKKRQSLGCLWYFVNFNQNLKCWEIIKNTEIRVSEEHRYSSRVTLKEERFIICKL